MTRVLPRFPTAVRGINALSASTENGVLEIGIDPTNLAESADPTAPGNLTFILNSTTGEFELAEVASTVADIATKEEAEAGTDNTAINTPLRTTQQVDARLATESEAESGSSGAKLMTPFTTAEAVQANVFPTRAELLTRNLPAVQTRVRTSGYSDPGVGGAEYVFVGSEPTHAGKFPTPDGRWWEIAEVEPDEAQFGAAADDNGATGTDDTTALQKLIDWAMESPRRRHIRLSGRCYCASDLTNVHNVIWRGSGSIRLMDGSEFYVSPNRQNRGFSGLGFNTLYIGVGTDTASGLAPSAPLASFQKAFDIIAAYGTPVQGYWAIEVAEGVYAPGGTTNNFESGRNQRVTIRGPAVDAWNNTTPPPAPHAITAITSANPPVVTSVAHGRSNGEKVFIGFGTCSGGAHAASGVIFTIANVTANTYELSGINGTGWAAYTGGGQAWPLVGSRPRAIIYGAGAATDGILVDGRASVQAYDLMVIGCGTVSSSDGIAGLLSTNGARLEASNCHFDSCGVGEFVRDASGGFFNGGYKRNCGSGGRAIHARFTFGVANPTSYRTDTPLYEDCLNGIDLWEGATGHSDGLKFKNCTTEIMLRRGAVHAVPIYNVYENTGSSKAGIHVTDGAVIVRTKTLETWTGTYRPRVQLTNGGRECSATLSFAAAVFEWRTKFVGNGAAVSPGGAESTQYTYNIEQAAMSARPQQLRAGLLLTGTWANGAVTVRFKIGATTVHTITLALNASARQVKAQIELMADNFNSVRGELSGWDKVGSAPSQLAGYFTSVFDTSAADQDFVVTVQCASASDSVTVQKVWLEGAGW